MKSKILLALFVIFSLLLNYVKAAETEPNNTPAQANVLPLNGSNSGLIYAAGDVDWYKVTTTGDGKLAITLNDFSNADYANVYLYDNNGAILINSNTATTNNAVTIASDGLAAGTYYVEVTGYNPSDTATYTISNTLTLAPVANDAEPDSTRALALTLPLDGSATGHLGYLYNNHRDSSDWYKVTANADGLLRLQLTDYPTSNNNYINMYLYDNDGVTQLNSGTSSVGNVLTLNTDGLAAGTYYVQIRYYNPNEYSDYKLADSLFNAPVANDAEPDSTRALALTLPLNGQTTGHAGYYYNNHRDSSDWYKVTTNADGLLRLQLTDYPTSNNNYINMYLYDNDGVTQLNSGASSVGNVLTLNTDGLAAGTYYVQIRYYNPNEYSDYKLADSLFNAPVATDKEPNNTKAQADTLPLNSIVTGNTGYYYNNHRDSTDWYQLTIPQDGMISLQLTDYPTSNNNYINMYLYDNDGVTQLNSGTSSVGNVLTLNTDGLAAGTYYVQIRYYNPSEYSDYSLKDSLYTYNPNDPEPNNLPYLAKTIPANRTVTGHLNFYYNGNRDNPDWWKINYTGTSGNLDLQLNLLPHNSNGAIDYVNFYVYKDTTASPILSNTYTSASNSFSLSGLTQGYYYIKLNYYNQNDFEAYSITDSFTQVNIAAISVKSTNLPNACSSNSITYNLSKSHSPYTVKLYHNGITYDSTIAAADTARFNNLPDGNYYATVYGDGATDSAYGKSAVTQFLPPYPTGLTTTNIGVHTATLNWTPTGCAKYYRIQYRAQGSSTWTTIDNSANTGGSYTLSSLTMYTTYSWHIAAVDSAQGQQLVSVYSDSALFLTLSDTAHIMLAHAGLGASCNSDTLQYQLSNSVAPYTVQLYRDGAVYGAAIMANATATFTGLPSGVYYATATGTGSGGSMGTSSLDTLMPPVPMGMYTDSIKSTSAMLNWNAVSCVNYFDVQYKQKDSANWTTVMTMGDMNSYNSSGLQPNTMYVWRVASVDTSNRQNITSAYSVVDTFITMSALPVTLSNFNAKPVNNTVQLSWQTLTEANSKYFEVQRSADGITFSVLNTVTAHGYSSASQYYTLVDNLPLQGNNYYRLKLVDNDGHFTYSNIIKIIVNGQHILFTVYPNPAKDIITVNLSVAVISPIITVYDMQGKIVLQEQLHGNIVSQQLNISRLAAGTYTVMLFDGTHRDNTKFIKE